MNEASLYLWISITQAHWHESHTCARNRAQPHYTHSEQPYWQKIKLIVNALIKLNFVLRFIHFEKDKNVLYRIHFFIINWLKGRLTELKLHNFGNRGMLVFFFSSWTWWKLRQLIISLLIKECFVAVYQMSLCELSELQHIDTTHLELHIPFS